MRCFRGFFGNLVDLGSEAGYGEPRRFGAFLRQAVRIAASSMSGATLARSTRVDPDLPHPPGTGEKMPGSSSTIPACSSGVNSRTQYPSDSSARVAKIRPPTRKSALPKCEPSTASGKVSAMRRKSAAVSAASPVKSQQFSRPDAIEHTMGCLRGEPKGAAIAQSHVLLPGLKNKRRRSRAS